MVNVGKYTIHGLFGYDTVIMSAKHYVLRCMKVRVETYLSFAQEYHFELKSMFIKQHFWFELILDMEDILCFILHSSTTLIDFCSRITVFFWEPVWNPGWTDHNDWINADFLCVCVPRRSLSSLHGGHWTASKGWGQERSFLFLVDISLLSQWLTFKLLGITSLLGKNN